MPDEAPGWDAIDAALRPVVGTREPQHWATNIGGIPDQDGIWGVSAYRFPDHLLYVTYGLTELFTKVSDDDAVSGWGAELTMRIAPSSPDEISEWPVALLARLGELVFQRATLFQPGGRMEMPDGASHGAPPALAWAEDPRLDPVDGPFGRFGFVATVGVSRELVEQMRRSTTEEVLDRIRSANPLLVTGGPALDHQIGEG